LRSRTVAIAGLLLLSVSSSEAIAQESFPDRFQIVLGDLKPGSGIAAGADYERSHFATSFFDLRLSTRVSVRLYQRHEVEVAIPHLFEPRLFLEVLAQYRSYTEVSYFGVGSETDEADRSNYHIEGPGLFATLGFRPAPRIAVGGRFGSINNGISSGRSSDHPSVEDAFSLEELPGYVEEPDYFLYSAFAAFDLRNNPFDPTGGSYFELQATRYRDRGFDRFNFDEVSVEAQRFVPLSDEVVLASRVKGVFTRTADGQEIPFYLLPSLGGTSNLHAFENDRFRDRHLLFGNLELRYQATPMLRLETFIDVGQVFPSFGEFRFSAFEIGSGVGARFKMGEKVLVGVSLGIGREGARVSLSGGFRF
jgi:outer membrane protein assembly factor BamA